MKMLIKKILRALFEDYQINWILSLDSHSLSRNDPQSALLSSNELIQVITSKDEFDYSSDQRIRDHAWYFDQHAYVYGVFEGNELACVCVFWTADHPNMPARFLNLTQNEAVMVDLITATQFRRKGYAIAVICFAENDLFNKGYTKLRTWVWHSNTPSIHVFNKLGWRFLYLLLEFKLYGIKNYFSFKLPSWVGRYD